MVQPQGNVQQRSQFDFGGIVKQIGDTVDKAKDKAGEVVDKANEVIDEGKKKIEEAKEGWNANVCDQFCNEVPLYEGKGVV